MDMLWWPAADHWSESRTPSDPVITAHIVGGNAGLGAKLRTMPLVLLSSGAGAWDAWDAPVPCRQVLACLLDRVIAGHLAGGHQLARL